MLESVRVLQGRAEAFRTRFEQMLAGISGESSSPRPPSQDLPSVSELQKRITSSLSAAAASRFPTSSWSDLTSALRELNECSNLAAKLSQSLKAKAGRSTDRARRLEGYADQLLCRLNEEQSKPFLRKLLRLGATARLTAHQDFVKNKRTAAYNQSDRNEEEARQLEASMAKISGATKDLGVQLGLFVARDVIAHFSEVEKGLQHRDLLADLDKGLIATVLEPRLDEAVRTERIRATDKKSILAFAHTYLGKQGPPHDVTAATERHVDYERLKAQVGFPFEELIRAVDLDGYLNSPFPSTFYGPLFSLLTASAAKRCLTQVETLLQRVGLVDEDRSVLQAGITRLCREVKFNLLMPDSPEAKTLEGVSRWRCIKDTPGVPEIFGPGGIERTEAALIRRLYQEDLSPGGYESWPGTRAVGVMTRVGGTAAIPYFVEHLKRHGSGHTNAAVADNLLRLWRDLPSVHDLPPEPAVRPTDQEVLRVLTSPNARFNRGMRPDGYSQAHVFKNPGAFLARERLTTILEETGSLPEEEVDRYYSGVKRDSPRVIHALLAQREMVEQSIVASRLDYWSSGEPALLAALSDPENGPVSLLSRTAEEGLGLKNPRLLGRLTQLVTAPVFAKNGFDRRLITEGILLLNTKPAGLEVLSDLLERYRGAKDDQRRLRQIMQFLLALDSLGEFTYPSPDHEHVARLSAQREAIRRKQPEITDKTERREAKRQVDRITLEIESCTGLKGLQEQIAEQLVAVAIRRLGLSDQGVDDDLRRKLDALMRSGVFEIVPTLLGRYEEKSLPGVIQTLKLITRHIVKGDFTEWRYRNPIAEKQLAGFSGAARQEWEKDSAPLILSRAPDTSQGSLVEAQLQSIRLIIKDAVQHLNEEGPRGADPEVSDSLQFFASLSVSNFSESTILDEAAKFARTLDRLDIQTARLDVEQLPKVFEERATGTLSAMEVSDPMALFRVGTEPQETCQSWRRGSFNECLLAYVADANKKAINVCDEAGRPLLRSIMKATTLCAGDDYSGTSKEPALFLEKPYVLLSDPEVLRSFFRLALEKAHAMQVSVALGFLPSEEWRDILYEEASRIGMTVVSDQYAARVYIPKSHNSYEYSDALGGKISYFDRFQEATVTLVRPKV